MYEIVMAINQNISFQFQCCISLENIYTSYIFILKFVFVLMILQTVVNSCLHYNGLCDKSLSVTCGRSVVSSTNKTDRHDITEILLKVALNTKTNQQTNGYRIRNVSMFKCSNCYFSYFIFFFRRKKSYFIIHSSFSNEILFFFNNHYCILGENTSSMTS